MRGVKASSSEKPVMVLRYSVPRVALFVFIFLPFGLALFSPLFMEPSEPISTFDRYFVGYGAPIFGILVIWLILDLLNTKQIEVYRDRIVKRVRVSFLTQRDKVMYLDKVGYNLMWLGILLSETRHIALRKGALIYTSRLKKEDEIRLAEFLAEVSGRKKDEFLYRPIFGLSFKKLIKRRT